MKQRLLLLICMLATTFCAKAYTVTFDVKFGSFMTDKHALSIHLYGNSGSYDAQYDESTATFIIQDVNAGKYNYNAEYPNMISLHRGNYQLEINSDITISLDFTIYHKASFKAPKGYSLNNMMVYYDNEDGGSTGIGTHTNEYYLPDGTYEWKSEIISANGMAFLSAKKQTFTMEGADKDIVYSMNPSDYHKVNITVKGHEGQAITSFNGTLRDNYNENLYYRFQSDANGKVTVMMENDSYRYTVYSTEYSEKRGNFKVTDADVNVQVSYENYSKLTIKATGSMLSLINSLSLYLVNSKDYDGGNSYQLIKISDTEYETEEYLAPTVFEYEITANLKEGIGLLPQSGQVNLAKEKTLNVDFSNYYPVTFTLTGEYEPETVNSPNVTIIEQDGYTYDFGLNQKTINMKSGRYTAEVSFDIAVEGNERFVNIYKDFTVEDKAQEVKWIYDASQYSMVTVNLVNVPDALKPYTENLYIKLFSGTRIYANEYVEDGLFVPKGTYTYAALNDDCGMIPLKGTVTATGNNDHIDLDLSQYEVTLIELRDIEGVQEDYDGFEIYINSNGCMTNVWQDHDYDYAILLEPAGTYLLSAISHDNGCGEKPITITAGAVNRETVTIVPRQAGKYMVLFEVNDISSNSNDEFECTVSLQGYGNLLLTNGYGIFNNVNAAEGLTYKVTAPGYHTVTGTVDVNEENSDNGIVDLYLRMRVDNSTGLETVKANNSFRVYPTVADNYINICANHQDETAWTIRMISTTGATVYTDKQVLDGEKQIYVGNLPKGFYLLILNNGEQQMTYKILKK